MIDCATRQDNICAFDVTAASGDKLAKGLALLRVLFGGNGNLPSLWAARMCQDEIRLQLFPIAAHSPKKLLLHLCKKGHLLRADFQERILPHALRQAFVGDCRCCHHRFFDGPYDPVVGIDGIAPLCAHRLVETIHGMLVYKTARQGLSVLEFDVGPSLIGRRARGLAKTQRGGEGGDEKDGAVCHDGLYALKAWQKEG